MGKGFCMGNDIHTNFTCFGIVVQMVVVMTDYNNRSDEDKAKAQAKYDKAGLTSEPIKIGHNDEFVNLVFANDACFSMTPAETEIMISVLVGCLKEMGYYHD